MKPRLISRRGASTPIPFDEDNDVDDIAIDSFAHSPIFSFKSPSPPPLPPTTQPALPPLQGFYSQRHEAGPLSSSYAGIAATRSRSPGFGAPSSLSSTMTTTMMMETSQSLESFASNFPFDTDEILNQEVNVQSALKAIHYDLYKSINV